MKKRKINISFRETMRLTGLPVIIMEIQGNMLNFVIDTGSSKSIIDSNIVNDFNISYDSIAETSLMGSEGIKSKAILGNITSIYEDEEYTITALIKDMKKPFDQFKKTRGLTVHGLLGSDFLEKYKYNIDFENYLAYVR